MKPNRENGGILAATEPAGTITVAVAVEAPQHAGLSATLDYHCERPLSPGTLVRVPLGKRQVPGIVWDRSPGAAFDAALIKPLGDVLDAMPPLPDRKSVV